MRFQTEFGAKEEQEVRSGFQQALDAAAARDGGSVISLAQNVWASFSSGRLPGHVQAVVGLALLYFIVPNDMVPDLTPLIGYGDDLIVLSAALHSLGSTVRLVGTSAALSRAEFRRKYGLDSDDRSGSCSTKVGYI